jgi:hypothetical protein
MPLCEEHLVSVSKANDVLVNIRLVMMKFANDLLLIFGHSTWVLNHLIL